MNVPRINHDWEQIIVKHVVRFGAVPLMLFVHWLLLLKVFVGDIVFGPCFVTEYFVSFLVLQLSRWERERAGCLTFIVFLM